MTHRTCHLSRMNADAITRFGWQLSFERYIDRKITEQYRSNTGKWDVWIGIIVGIAKVILKVLYVQNNSMIL